MCVDVWVADISKGLKCEIDLDTCGGSKRDSLMVRLANVSCDNNKINMDK